MFTLPKSSVFPACLGSALSRVFAETLKKYRRHAVVPGFRKGKVPANVVENRYQEDIREDVTRSDQSNTFCEIWLGGVQALTLLQLDFSFQQSDHR